MLRAATIAAAILGIIVALASVAGGGAFGTDAKPDKPPQPIFVVAPMDGIFWRAEYPGGAPYVEIGQTVHMYTVVAHIEHMRTTPLTAGCDGAVAEFLVTDGQFVKAFQPLVRVVPTSARRGSAQR